MVMSGEDGHIWSCQVRMAIHMSGEDGHTWSYQVRMAIHGHVR